MGEIISHSLVLRGEYMEKILSELEDKIEEHLKDTDLELSDIEYVREGGYNYLRIYVEKEDGTTSLDDCIEVSKRIDNIADEMIDEKFFLEVSTPGIERKLKKEKDFLRFLGEKIKVYVKSKIEGKKTFEGILEKCENGVIFIQDERLEKLIEIPIIKLKKSNIVYELPNDILNSEEE